MGEFDSFNPYSGYEEENGAVARIKSKLPLIIFLAVLVIVGWFVYDTFFGNFVEINISVKDAGGVAVSAKSIEVFKAGEEKAVFTAKNKMKVSTKLKAGDYEVIVKATGYSEKSDTFTADEENFAWIIKLEKEFAKDVELSVNVPSEIVGGQTISGKLIVKNKGKNTLSLNLKEPTANSKELQTSISISTVTVQAGGEMQANISITATKNIETTKEGKKYSVTFGVEGISVTKTHEITAFAAPELTYPTSIKMSGNAGKTSTTNIDLQNKGKVDVKNIHLKVELTNVETNPDALNWFYFSTTSAPEITIDSIVKSTKSTPILKVDVPVTAKKEVISGKLIISSEMLAEDIIVPVELDIKTEVHASVSLTLSKNEIKIAYSAEQEKYEIKLESFKIKNESDIIIGKKQNDPPIIIQVKSNECTEEWLFELEPNTIDSLSANGESTIWFKASAPANAFGGEDTDVLCTILVSYTNPITKEKDEIEKNIYIIAEQTE